MLSSDNWIQCLLEHAWHQQFLPSSVSDFVAGHFGLHGPRLCYATACASGVVSLLAAARMIEEDQADMALAGAADAVTEIILTSFYRMACWLKAMIRRGPASHSIGIVPVLSWAKARP